MLMYRYEHWCESEHRVSDCSRCTCHFIHHSTQGDIPAEFDQQACHQTFFRMRMQIVNTRSYSIALMQEVRFSSYCAASASDYSCCCTVPLSSALQCQMCECKHSSSLSTSSLTNKPCIILKKCILSFVSPELAFNVYGYSSSSSTGTLLIQ
jgi:hypothetical protein